MLNKNLIAKVESAIEQQLGLLDNGTPADQDIAVRKLAVLTNLLAIIR